jgi:feruloyl esterase
LLGWRREALIEAQRFPQDFDGIVAGAPAQRWTDLLTRPLCPYPQAARWDGKGKVEAAASFSCR